MESDAEARLRRLFGDDEPPEPTTDPAATDAGSAASPEASMGPWIGLPPDPAPESSVAGAESIDAGAAPEAARPLALEPAGSHRAVTQRVVRSTEVADERRRQLWRDSATILIGVVIALLVMQSVGPPSTGEPGSSATDLPSGVVIRTVGPAVSLPPGATLPPIIDPSLGIDATPTPIPVITMGPTPTPGPSVSPSPSIKPSSSPKPSKSPGASVAPTAPPPTAPPPTAPPPTDPPPTEPPPTPAPPAAQFTWTTTLLLADFTNTSTGDTSWDWDFGDSTGSSAQNPSHLYAAPGDYTVKLTVTGPGGTDTVTHVVSVAET